MPIFDLFSKRQMRLRGEVPDVYQYQDIPNHLRVQIIHIIRDVMGRDRDGTEMASGAYKFIHKSLCREYGVFELKEYSVDADAVFDFFLKCKDNEKAIDVIELLFRVIDTHVRTQDYQNRTREKNCQPDAALDELNARFKEHGVGYQYESGSIIRIDSEFLHAEAVIPTLTLLGKEKRFRGANEEFLKAHEHYRNGRHKECLVDSLKALESVMKAICDKQKWPYNQNDTAKRLIDVCFQHELVPTYLQSQFSSLRSLIESGVPTVRNKLGGHGQGTVTTKVDGSIASYALHLAASNIVFLAQLEKDNFG